MFVQLFPEDGVTQLYSRFLIKYIILTLVLFFFSYLRYITVIEILNCDNHPLVGWKYSINIHVIYE